MNELSFHLEQMFHVDSILTDGLLSAVNRRNSSRTCELLSSDMGRSTVDTIENMMLLCSLPNSAGRFDIT